MRVLVSSALVLLGLTSPAAQPPAAPPAGAAQTRPDPVFRTGVGLVRVDVTVSDRNHRPIQDLTVDDFEVREDGTVQQVTALQFVRLTGRPAAGDDLSLDIRSPEHAAREAAREDVRLLVLFVDDYHLRHGPQFDVRLRRMLRRFVEAEMQPTDLFAVMGPLTPLSALDLTRAKADVLARIDRIEGRLGSFAVPRSPLEESHMLLRPGDRGRIRTEVSIGALKALADYLGALHDGRKTVLFVSEGPGLHPFGGSGTDAVREAVTAANRANVVIHTLDPRDLMSGGFGDGVNSTLAADTGGREIGRSNDFSAGLRAVIADASAYYLLGYVPTRPPNDGKFHRIDVKVRRKGARVLARRGYWAATTDETRPRPAATEAPADVTAARGALAEPPRGRLVDWWIGHERGRAGSSALILSWERGAGEGADAVGAVRLAIGEDDGSSYRAAAPEAGTPAGPWQVRAILPSRPGKVRVVVEDRAGRSLQSWTQEIDWGPPEADGLALDTPKVVGGHAPEREDAPPIARRRFRRTERVAVVVGVHAAAGRSPQVDAELLNGSGTRLVVLPVEAGAGGLARVELPLANLAQAEYVVRVTARDGDARASAAVAFALVR